MITYIVIHGGQINTPRWCSRAGWLYGAQFGYTMYGDVYMLDYTGDGSDWQAYMKALKFHKPALAVVMDYRLPYERAEMQRRVFEVAVLGIIPVVVAKHLNSLAHIPECAHNIPTRIGISVPTTHMNDGFLPDLEEFRRYSNQRRSLHFLGGHPDQWAYLRQYYAPIADVASIDGNAAIVQARSYGKFWLRQGGYRDMRRQDRNTEAMIILGLRNARRYMEAVQRWQNGPRIIRCKQQLGLLPMQQKLFQLSAQCD